MHSPDYDYHGLCASTWDIWRDNTANWSDRNLFLSVIEQFGQPVLDLGGGTGRLILDYLSLGIDTDGVDNSPEMLSICRAKAETSDVERHLFQQRLQDLSLPRRYRTILGPSSILQLVTDPALALDAVRRIHDHLERGGAFIASFSFQWTPGEPLDTGWVLLFEKPRGDGAVVRSWTRERRDPDEQLWHTEQKFEVEHDGAIEESQHQRRSPEGRWYSQIQATDLFRSARLTNVRTLHDFTVEPARPDSKVFCVIGESR